MRVYYASDLHNDYHGRNSLLDITGDDKAVLVVAGDINSKGHTLADLEEVADRWLAIVAVLGNHDWWKLALHETHKFKSTKPNVHILMNESIEINGVLFVGTTLWHPVDDALAEYNWRLDMNDAKYIRGPNYAKLKGLDIHAEYLKGVKLIKKHQHDPVPIKILVTHHALCDLSVSERYTNHSSNRWYVTNKPDILEGYQYHIHGHIHSENNYDVYGCQVLSNPKGYSLNECPDYGIRLFDTKDKHDLHSNLLTS